MADDARRSLLAGHLVHLDTAPTICDGQQAPIGELTFSLLRPLVERIVTVSDLEVAVAMRILFEDAKLAVEPSGASGPAGRCGTCSRSRP